VRSPLPIVAVVCAAWALACPAVAVEPGFQVCVDQFPLTPLQRIVYGVDAGSARLDDLTAEGYRNAAALEAGNTWDFSGVTGGVDILQMAPVSPAWSCSVAGRCGGFGRSDVMLVEDDGSSGNRTVTALDHDGSGTIYARVMVFSDGAADQVQVCFESSVGFIRFQSPGLCLAEGDPAWSTGLDCDKSATMDDPCGRDDPAAGLDGTFSGRAARAGTLWLPSGHVVDSVLVRVHASVEAQALLFGLCTVAVEEMRQYMLFWLVPHYGPLVQMTSPSGSTDLSWETTNSTTIGFGLLPPLAIQVTDVGADTITVSWDPGADTRFIDEYVVHWGEEPGALTPPPFDSEWAGDTIPAGRTDYTIRGLSPGTWYVSVTAKSRYTDPVSGVETEYRSIALPLTIGADIDGDGVRDTSYPPETSAEVTGAGLPSLLRDWLIWREPPEPPLFIILPLDPVEDRHLENFPSGAADTQGVLGNQDRLLIYYALDADATLHLEKTPAWELRIWY